MLRTRRYHVDNLPTEMIVKDGVTYCSPRFLASFLSKTGFFYNGEVYCFAGEYVESELINERDSEIFKPQLLTTLYAMKLFMPYEYEFARTYLTGGIKCVAKNKVAAGAEDAVSYIYPSSSKPICYIVNGKNGGRTLTSYIAHEAYHVYQYRTYGINGEYCLEKYGKTIFNKLK